MSDIIIEYPQHSAEGLPLTYVPDPFLADGKPADGQWKAPVRTYTEGALTLSGLQPVNGIGVMEGDRVLVKDQLDPAENGIYVASATAWRRAADMFLWPQFVGAVVAIEENPDSGQAVWACQVAAAGVLGTDPVYWTTVSAFSGSLGAFTPLRAIVADASGNPAASPTTSQEIAFVSGVTSAIQPQLSSVVSTANGAYAIAVAGTNAAATAQSRANSAFGIAVTGTNTASAAFSIAVAGTNAAATAQSTANAAYTVAVAGTTVGSAAYAYALTLGDKYVRTTRFTTISSGTSGTVTLPENAAVVLDDFGGTTDAVVTGLGGGRPTSSHVFTTSGAVVTAAFNSGGNYTLSGAPDSYPVALVYRVRQKLSEYTSTDTDIIGGYDVEALDSVQGTADQVYVNGSLGPQYGPLTVSLPQSIGTNSDVVFNKVTALQGVFDSIDPVNYIDFNIVNAGTLARNTGRLHWDMTDLTMSLDMYGSNVTLQVGQETVMYARNESGVPIPNGSVVYVSGATGQRPTVALADATVRAQAVNVVGVATEDIAHNMLGYVTLRGLVRDVNTNAFTEGDALYLGAAPGALTTTVPQPPESVVYVGIVVKKAGGSGIIYVNARTTAMLGEISDVNTSGKINGSTLVYNGSVWVTQAGTATPAYELASTAITVLTTITAGTTSVPAGPQNRIYLANSAAGDVTVALPNTLGWSGQLISVKKLVAANSVIVSSRTGTQTIDGVTSQTITGQYVNIQVTTDGSNWYIL